MAVVGTTNIIVSPAHVFKPVRSFVDKYLPWFSKLFACNQCTGTWVGFLCGFILLSTNPFYVFLCGMAASYWVVLVAVFMRYLDVSIMQKSSNGLPSRPDGMPFRFNGMPNGPRKSCGKCGKGKDPAEQKIEEQKVE